MSDTRRTIDRRPIERVLPPGVLAELRQAGTAGVTLTPTFARQVVRQLNLDDRFGLSPRRVLNYLKRVAAGELDGKPDPPQPSPAREPARDARLAVHRERQGSIAVILESCFGGPASQKPELWEQRAYLMLIGLVYERLATSAEDISSSELSTLAKVLVDARRAFGAGGKQAESASSEADAKPSAGALPKSFREAVQQVYGTKMPEPMPKQPSPVDEERRSTESQGPSEDP